MYGEQPLSVIILTIMSIFWALCTLFILLGRCSVSVGSTSCEQGQFGRLSIFIHEASTAGMHNQGPD